MTLSKSHTLYGPQHPLVKMKVTMTISAIKGTKVLPLVLTILPCTGIHEALHKVSKNAYSLELDENSNELI